MEISIKYFNDDLFMLFLLKNYPDFNKNIYIGYDIFKSLNIMNEVNYYKYKIYCHELNDFSYEQMLSLERLQDREYFELLDENLESDIIQKKLSKKLLN